MKMCYSIEPRDRRHVKGYGFLSFAKNIGKNISNKYSQKFGDSAIKSGATKVPTDPIKTALKTAEATGDLTGNNLLIRLRVYQKKLKIALNVVALNGIAFK